MLAQHKRVKCDSLREAKYILIIVEELILFSISFQELIFKESLLFLIASCRELIDVTTYITIYVVLRRHICHMFDVWTCGVEVWTNNSMITVIVTSCIGFS